MASLHLNLEKAEEVTGTVESGTLLPLKNISPLSHQECQPFEGGKPNKHQGLCYSTMLCWPLVKDDDNDNSDLRPDNATSLSIPGILTDQTSDLEDTCFTSPDIVSGGSLLRSPANKDLDMASMTKLNHKTEIPRDPQHTECDNKYEEQLYENSKHSLSEDSGASNTQDCYHAIEETHQITSRSRAGFVDRSRQQSVSAPEKLVANVIPICQVDAANKGDRVLRRSARIAQHNCQKEVKSHSSDDSDDDHIGTLEPSVAD